MLFTPSYMYCYIIKKRFVFRSVAFIIFLHIKKITVLLKIMHLLEINRPTPVL